MKTTVSERGQITLPKAVRLSLGLRPGSILDISVVDGHLVGEKRELGDPESRWRGRGREQSPHTSTADYLAEVRD